MPPSNRVHTGVCAVVPHDGNLLMLLRRGGDGHGRWSIPGGWVEHDDADAESTAVREVREETRVWVEPHAAGGHTVHTIEYPESREGDKAVTLFVVCRYVHGDAVNAEPDKASEVRWVPLGEVADLVLWEPLAMWWRANGRYLMVEGV